MNYQTVYAFLSDKKQSGEQTQTDLLEHDESHRHHAQAHHLPHLPHHRSQGRMADAKRRQRLAHYADSDLIPSEYRDLRDEPAPENDYERHPLAGFVEGATGF